MRTRMLAFFVGIVLFTQLPFLPSIYWSGLLLLWPAKLLASLFCKPPSGLIPFSIQSKQRAKNVDWFSLHLLCVVTGACWILIHAHFYYSKALPADWQRQTIEVVGEVISIPIQNKHKQSFQFKVDYAKYNSEKIKLGKIKLSWYRTNQVIKAGQRWELAVRLKQPYSMLNPGGFDYEKWMMQQNIVATGYVYSKAKHELLSYNPYSLAAIRQLIYEKLSHALGDSDEFGIILALTLGERHKLTEQQWNVFKQTGTSHLVAISGLHIGLIAGLAFLMSKLVWRMSGRLNKFIPAPYAAAYFSVFIAIVYAALAGFSIPTLRACIMYSVVILTFVLKRNPASWDILLFALTLVLLINPVSILSAGFWLSFAAVFVIAYVVTGQLRINKLKSYFVVQYAIFIFLLPFLLVNFSQISLVAPVVNLIVIPLMSVVLLPATLIGVLLVVINTQIGTIWFDGLHYVYDLFWQIESGFAALPAAVWHTSQTQPGYYLLALLGAILLVFPKYLPHKWLGVILFLPCLLPQEASIEEGDLVVTFLDVSQGTAVVVETKKHLLVYDTGAKFSAKFDMGKNVILPYLKQTGKTSINKLVVSHGDNDHIGGADTLIKNFIIKNIESSVAEKIPAKVEPCLEGDEWRWDNVRFTYLSPAEFQYKSIDSDGHQQNNASCVLLITAGQYRVLLTGDIEKATEYRLVHKYGDQLRANLLLVPHHGSNTSSTSTFLQQVMPEHAIFTAGYLNRYRHPSQKVIARYARHTDARLYNTSETGAIRFHIRRPQQLHNDMADITLYRHQSQRFWRHENMIK